MANKEQDPMKDAKVKAARYCAYRERAPSEVRQKLKTFGLSQEQVEQVYSELVSSGFVDEARFALAFASGKFRMKKWGKLKIEHSLQQHQISSSLIEKALNSLPENEYLSMLSDIIQRKQKTIKSTDPFVANHKVARFAISKGYEPELVWKQLVD